ncbi:Eosinophil peroxidase [Liparis tanakae]|uniref:Eosinophil peroxidase n=1 Tax=Liparis tanakae TaxID=230148 RepID=A0A4Z2HZP2_9TELE|nr:Eosinophil peroxidase [Liparis tanakae]
MLPLVRQVSNNILSTTDAGVVNDTEFTHMVTLFGQWNDHDLTFTPFSPSIRSFSNGINCDESCEKTEPCIPIAIPRGDPRLPTGPDSCIPSFRSAPVCGTGNSAFNFGGEPTKREQINALTAFLDLGQVYGSEEKLALFLRDLNNDGGLLRVNTEFRDNRRELLPFSPLQANMCATRRRTTNDTSAREVPCFIAGDVRVDENIALTSIHTLFMREHNRLARELKRLNPQWDSETLYQEARKIMGAYTQVLVFRDYLPHIVGADAMRRQLGRYPGYSPNVDPSIANVFATAAFRFAHLAIQPFLARLDASYRETSRLPSVPLFKAFFAPWRIIFEGGIEPLLRGLIVRPAKLNTQDHMMVDALREKLFKFVMDLALDLGSLNMQRGRDHGLPGYNAWRKLCGLSQPRNQAQLAQVLNNRDLARRMLQLYGTTDNIDVWMGGVAEPFVRGGRVGPLFSCLIATQFQRIRQGDRLWYENSDVFTAAQRSALSAASISRIICDNTGISSVPADPFRVLTRRNRLVRCSNVRRLNLSAWRERACTGSGDDCNEVSENETVKKKKKKTTQPEQKDLQELQELQGLLDNEVISSVIVCPIGPPGPPGEIILNPNATQSQSAFSILLGEDNPSSEKIIHFRHVQYNKQNLYSTDTGLFTCVTPGVYQFSFLIISIVRVGDVDLKVNSKQVLRAFKVYQAGSHLSSGDTLLQLEAGDKVWLEASSGTTGLSTRSYFSGHLVFAA